MIVATRKDLYNAIRPVRGRCTRRDLVRILSRIGTGPSLDLDVACQLLRVADLPGGPAEARARDWILEQIAEGGPTRRLLERRALARGRL